MLAETYAKGLITKRQASPLKACFKGDRALMGSLADYQIQFEAPEKTPDPLKIPGLWLTQRYLIGYFLQKNGVQG